MNLNIRRKLGLERHPCLVYKTGSISSKDLYKAHNVYMHFRYGVEHTLLFYIIKCSKKSMIGRIIDVETMREMVGNSESITISYKDVHGRQFKDIRDIIEKVVEGNESILAKKYLSIKDYQNLR